MCSPIEKWAKMWEVRVLGYVATDNPHILSGLKHKVGFLGYYPCPLQGRRVILIDNLITESSYIKIIIKEFIGG